MYSAEEGLLLFCSKSVILYLRSQWEHEKEKRCDKDSEEIQAGKEDFADYCSAYSGCCYLPPVFSF